MIAAARALARLAALGGAVALLASCESFKPAQHIVPGPSGALGAAPLADGRVAVLAGTDTTRAIFIVDLQTGTVKRSFGVTREATGVTAATPRGPLLLTIAARGKNGRASGAIELWGLDGRKRAVVPSAAPAIAITQVSSGQAYVLMSSGADARAAAPLDIRLLRFGRAMPLEAEADSLQLCKIGPLEFLVYTLGSPGPVLLRDLASGAVLRSQISARNPTCLAATANILAIEKTLLTTSVVVLSVPGMLQATSIPMSADLIDVYDTPDPSHAILALNSTRAESTLELLPADTFTVGGAAPPK